jgi:hypothetical protein
MSSVRCEDEPPESATASLRIGRDDAFHLLSNSRRRAVMRRLLEVEGSTELGDLAEHVAALENGCERSELSSDDRKRVYISLYQGHLPKLAEHGVVDYDQARGTVTPRPLVRAFVPYLDETPLSVDGEASAPPESSHSGLSTALSSLFGR